MNQQPQNNEISLTAIDYWQVVKNRYGVILLTLLLVFMTVAVITYVMPRKFESSTTIEVKPREKIVDVGSGMSALKSTMTPQFFATEFEKIRSRNSLSIVVDELGLVSKWSADKETCIAILKGIVATQNIRGTDLISISVRHTNKEDAKDIVEEVAKAYRLYRGGLEDDTYTRGINELTKAVRAQEDRVEENKKELYTITRMKGLIYWGPAMNQGYSGIDADGEAKEALSSFYALENESLELESRINNLTKYTSEQLWIYASGLDLPDNIIKSLYSQYLSLQREIDGMKANGYGNKHPTILSNQKVLKSMEGQLNEGIVHLKNRLQGQMDMLNERLGKARDNKDKKKQDAVGESLDTQEFFDAKRKFETDQTLLDGLKLKLLTAQMDAKITSDSIIVHEKPTISDHPVSPNVRMNLALGAVVGLVFGIGIAFFLEFLDTSVKTLEDVERYLQVPVLAVIPKDVGILHRLSGTSPDAEAYRILRTNIEFNRKNPEDNAITVVSGGAGEGKSTTMVNLAYICAQGGYTTLMIDADLRRPKLHTFFDVNNSVGLTNYLTTELMLEDVILQTPIDNLYFLPSGILPADAAGILNSRRMSELIQDVKQRFDLVLVDSPPILGVSDASVIASEVDLTMIVVQHRKLPRNMLLRVKQAVENVGGHVLGVVLNNVDVRSDSQYQYYTSYYTYYAPAEHQLPRAQQGSTPKPAKANAQPDSDLY